MKIIFCSNLRASHHEGFLDFYRLCQMAPFPFCCCSQTNYHPDEGNLLIWRLLFFTFSPATAVGCLVSAELTAAASDCELFEESKLCVSQLTNLIDRQPTEDELVCQKLCQSSVRCSHFTFVENKYPLETGEPNLQCYLWKRCIKKVNSNNLFYITGILCVCVCVPL